MGLLRPIPGFRFGRLPVCLDGIRGFSGHVTPGTDPTFGFSSTIRIIDGGFSESPTTLTVPVPELQARSSRCIWRGLPRWPLRSQRRGAFRSSKPLHRGHARSAGTISPAIPAASAPNAARRSRGRRGEGGENLPGTNAFFPFAAHLVSTLSSVPSHHPGSRQGTSLKKRRVQMKHAEFWVGILIGAIGTAVIATAIGAHARAQELPKLPVGDQTPVEGNQRFIPDPKFATEPFVYRDTVVDQRNTNTCLVNAAFWSLTPTGDIQLDVGSLHWSTAYASQHKLVAIMQMSTRLIMRFNDAQVVDNQLQQAMAAYLRNHPTTQPATQPAR